MPDKEKATLGDFEQLVLVAALRLGDQAYGLSIANEILQVARRPAARASVYVTLRRLERQGLIRTHHEDPEDSAARGKPRRLVEVLPAGLKLVRESRRSLLRIWSGLEEVLENEA